MDAPAAPPGSPPDRPRVEPPDHGPGITARRPSLAQQTAAWWIAASSIRAGDRSDPRALRPGGWTPVGRITAVLVLSSLARRAATDRLKVRARDLHLSAAAPRACGDGGTGSAA
jgi:hypothetical protein